MRAVLMTTALALVLGCSGRRMTRASSALYVRDDSNATTVVTPQVAVAADVSRATNLGVDYIADAWSSASVDIVTAATGTVTELRHEVDVKLVHERGRARFNAAYRFSLEPDYLSHGIVAGARVDLARRNTTLGLDVIGSRDTVGRAGDELFARRQLSGGLRASVAQLLDRDTLVELAAEGTLVDGFQASPYRWVAIGGDGTCASLAPFCVPEQVPGQRLRANVFVRARRALGEWWSTGLEYRYYADTWGIQSHAIGGDVAWRVTRDSLVDLRYRYYTQGEAEFYRPRYAELGGTSGFVTRDRKHSAFFTHELGASVLQRIELDELGDRVIVAGLRAGLTAYDYLAFVGLDHVLALELTMMLALEIP